MSASPAAEPVRVSLAFAADFQSFRTAARRLVAAGVAPRDVAWVVGEENAGLFGAGRPVEDLPDPSPADAPRAPRAFVDLCRLVVCHRDESRFALLHRLLERLQAEPKLLEVASDPDVARANTMAKNVRRCSHKMKAFVRFRATEDADSVERYVAWFEPEHHTLDLTAPFFVRRFASMRWSILTPTRSAHWDGEELTMAEGASRDVAPDGDVNEELWRTYFGAIFNPARLKVKAMTAEMPKRYWKNMPEADLIDPLIREASDKTRGMIAAPARAPARSTRVAREREAEEARMADMAAEITTLDDLRSAARACERCPLYRDATQVVVGEGAVGASVMLVGEQPGDQEDLQGHPFVGPAGQMLDRALKEAGIDRGSTFVTNAVKHFKFEPRGKRRIHKKPDHSEIDHCRFWLDLERALVRPKVTVALGATAARALAGRTLTISKVRGRPHDWPDGSAGFVTVHPSYLLRLPDPEAKRQEYSRFVEDLAAVRDLSSTVSRAQ
jgi:DNA polymerase